jgi:LCP family protein required for cell wall assembly
MRKIGIFIIVMVVVLVTACSLATYLAYPRGSMASRNDYLLVAPPGSTSTPTPFQPNPPTPTYLQSSMGITATLITAQGTPAPEILDATEEAPPWGNYAGPSVWPDVDIPTPVGVLPHPDSQVNILLLGSDQRPNDGGFRTDTIQLLTINPEEGTVKLTAFPRDLYVYIPGYTVQRINTAMGWGGFNALAETMEYNFGVKPDYYVLINFWSFKDVVDSIGGITVNAGRDLCDQRNAMGQFCVYRGLTWMDGETALWYVRSRYSTSDLDRGRRQQEVLEAIFDKLMSLDSIKRAPDLFEIYKQNVTTNLDFNAISSLIPVASNLVNSQPVERHAIGEDQVYNWVTPSGAMVLVPIREAVLDVMRQAISQP